MTLAGFATQTPFQIFLGTLEVLLFFLCIVLALHSLYARIARWFSNNRPSARVNVTINEMYDPVEDAKKNGPPYPDIEGK